MIEGIIAVDKPPGLTSHDVVGRIRHLAGTRRVGHGGTLDPLASGLLVIAVGRATRLLEYVLGQAKEYQALVRLGQTSTTYDGEGELADSGDPNVSQSDVIAALGRFRGDIEQIPPMYSAVKQEGKPLYQLARKGVAVEREPRNVIIYELELLSHETPDLTLHVRCSSGTYIRSLAHDLGQELGCGAYLAGLRRTVVGHFELRHALPLNALTAETLTDHVQAMDSAVLHLPRLLVRRQEAESLSQGQRILVGEGHPQQELVRAYDETGRFVGIVTREQSQWRPRKIFYEDPSSASRC